MNNARLILATLLVSLLSVSAGAKVKMPAIFADNMVLQQNTDANIWGKGDAGKKVTVAPGWTKQKYTTTVASDGTWHLAVPTPAAGGPYDITISDGEKLTLKNVMLGEVWFCSGQSNMEMPMKGFVCQPVEGSSMAVAKSKNPNIRLFTMKKCSSSVPMDDCVGTWQEAEPKSVYEFSATAYFFGRMLEEVLDVPVGLVVVAWGGSALEAWMGPHMVKGFPEAEKSIPEPGTKVKAKSQATTALFNGMVSPLIGMSMRGVIWYQGETNCVRAHSYADLFSSMIKGWRTLWKQGDFPFYYCQITPYEYDRIIGKGQEIYNSAYLREAQAKVEQMVPNTGMAVLMDAGFDTGIHPYNKQTPGERLALHALSKTYGIEGIIADSPIYKEMKVMDDGSVEVYFDRCPMELCGDRSFESKNFTLAGEDRVFYPAKAEILRGKKVKVTCDKVPHPVAVRYGFVDYCVGDLFGNDNLPVSSFRSDNWEDPKPIKQ